MQIATCFREAAGMRAWTCPGLGALAGREASRSGDHLHFPATWPLPREVILSWSCWREVWNLSRLAGTCQQEMSPGSGTCTSFRVTPRLLPGYWSCWHGAGHLAQSSSTRQQEMSPP